MLHKLPPELLLLIVDHLGHKSLWNLAASCTQLWARLGHLAKLRSQHAVYTITDLDGSDGWPPWQNARQFIESIFIIHQAGFYESPNDLFWVDRAISRDEEGINWQGHGSKKPHKFPNLRAIHLPVAYVRWLHLISIWSMVLHMDSPFDTLNILTLSGRRFGFLELDAIFQLPSLKHLRIEGPRNSWDDGSENLGSFVPKSSSIETLQLVHSRMSVTSACRLVAACKALKAFAYWQPTPSSRQNALIECIWDSSIIIHTLCEHQSESLRVLSLISESVDRHTLPSTSLKRLAHLESLTCIWDYIMPGATSHRLTKELYNSLPKQLSEILPSGLKILCLEESCDEASYSTQVLALRTYLASQHCPLHRIRLPYRDKGIAEAAASQGIKYEVARVNVCGVNFCNRKPFASPDFDGDWVADFDKQENFLQYEAF